MLPKILIQIQQTAIQSQRALSMTRQQVATKERERRILQLTIDEIGSMEGDVKLYKGVGKMYVPATVFPAPLPTMVPNTRFMMMPRPVMEKDLKSQEKGLTDDINSLNKKVKRPMFYTVTAYLLYRAVQIS